MKQFNEAIAQSEETLFQQWNPMTTRAGERGLQIDLAPVASELRSMAKKPDIALVSPQIVPYLEHFAEMYEKQGMFTPLEAQNVVKSINAKLTEFYDKGAAATDAPATVLEPVARLLRKQLDEGIEGAIGPGWQRLRDDYKALRSMDKDVTRAVERLAKKPESALARFGNLVSSAEFLHGVFGLNPTALARAFGVKGATELHRFLNDPNHLIESMFTQRMRGPPRAASVAAPLTQGVARPAMTYGLSTPQRQRDPDKEPRGSTGQF